MEIIMPLLLLGVIILVLCSTLNYDDVTSQHEANVSHLTILKSR